MGGSKPCGELDGLGTRSITELVYDATWALLWGKKKKEEKASQKKRKNNASQNSSMIPRGPSCVKKKEEITGKREKGVSQNSSMILRGPSYEGKKEIKEKASQNSSISSRRPSCV